MKSPKAFSRLWRRVGSGPRSVALLLALGGVALVLASMLPGPPPDDAWLRDLLMTVGGSLALFAPLYLVTRSLDRHLDRVAEETERRVEEVRTDTAQQVQQVRDEAAAAKSEMEALRQDVAQRLDDIDAQVRSRLEQEEASDVAAIEALRDAPSRDAVMAALRRAHEMALVSVDRPPRVKISKSLQVYLSVEYTPDPMGDTLRLRVETLGGKSLDVVDWWAEKEVSDVLFEVGRILRKRVNETIDSKAFFTDLAHLLEVAQARPSRRPAVQLCPPQWLVTGRGVVTSEGRHMMVMASDLWFSEKAPTDYINGRTWVDEESFNAAVAAFRILFPAPRDDKPPF